MNIGFGLRGGLRMQDPNKPQNMNEVHFDTAYTNVAEARFNGDITKNVGWTANFNAYLMGSTLAPAGAVGVEDLIVRLKAADEFNIWAGRLLVPSDRSNFTGPFFMSPWNYPGFYFGGPPLGPKDGPNGRDQGVTVWGNALDAKLKYYAGAYGLDQGGPTSTQSPTANAYYSARLSYSLQGSEPGYFGSSTYYGAKNVVTLGAAVQSQKDGSVDRTSGKTTDTFLFMADILAEETIAGTGTFDFEGQFYKFNDGYAFGPKRADGSTIFAPGGAFYVLVSYLTPQPIGIGKLQPLVRVQSTFSPADKTPAMGGAAAVSGSPWTIVDAGLAYVIKDYGARIVATYEHIDTGNDGGQSNAIQLGVQVQELGIHMGHE
jgi:hypothetical protein